MRNDRSKKPAQVIRQPWNDPNSIPFIRVEGVSKNFGDYSAVNRLDLEIYQGELFSLLGPSGCGKTTLLRMLAGFETPTEGKIFIDGVDMSNIPPYERPVNMMFQSYALFPHMSVEQNVAFGLKQDKVPKSEIKDRVQAMLEIVRCTPYASRKPHQLSGGQRQRVALARSLVKEPKVLLLDEPLGALDKKLREQTQFELVNIQERVGITFVVVTHDQEEAMTMSSRIGVMNGGRIEQIGQPAEIYEYPNTSFVADFIGTANLWEGVVVEDHDDYVIVHCSDLGINVMIRHAGSVPLGAPIMVMVRPEKMSLERNPPLNSENKVKGIITEIAYLGDISIYHIRLESGIVIEVSQTNLRHTAEQKVTWEDDVWITWHPANAVVLMQ